jgi:hypothetical protein
MVEFSRVRFLEDIAEKSMLEVVHGLATINYQEGADLSWCHHEAKWFQSSASRSARGLLLLRSHSKPHRYGWIYHSQCLSWSIFVDLQQHDDLLALHN